MSHLILGKFGLENLYYSTLPQWPKKRGAFLRLLRKPSPKTDLAVIKIELDTLPAATGGDSSQLEVGEIILAIGNPFDLNQNVTKGLVSAA